MQQASEQKNGKEIALIGVAISRCQTEIDLLFDTLEKQMDELESKKSVFDARLAELQDCE